MGSPFPTTARMKSIGIIGGSTHVATAEYYTRVTAAIMRRLGGYHTDKIIINSMDLATSVYCVKNKLWDDGARHIRDVVGSLDRAGAELVICVSNTWHRCADRFMARAKIPLLRIADATAQAVKAKGLKCVALLGTQATISGTHLRDIFREKHGLEVPVPEEEEQVEIDRVVFEELSLPVFREESREYYLGVVDRLRERGAEGMILGCTEIPLLVKQEHRPGLPMFDTLVLHAEAAAEEATAGMQRSD
jgi:aspartate racemase